jgi:hypothetical protein
MASSREAVIDEPEEEPGRSFEPWWANYRDPYFQIQARGPLVAKCRDAAADLVEELLVAKGAPSASRADVVRVLTCLILDGYLLDRWDYEEA